MQNFVYMNFNALWLHPMSEVRHVLKHLQKNLMDYIGIWGNQLCPEHFQNMHSNKTGKPLVSLEKLITEKEF